MLRAVRLFPSRRPNVRRLRRKGDLAGLRRASRYEDFAVDREGLDRDLGVPVRVEAVQAIASFYGPQVTASLADALDDPHPTVRLAAVEGMAELGVPAAPDRLVRCYVRWDAPSDHEAAQRALEALVAWEHGGAAEVLVDELMGEEAPPIELRHRDGFRELLDSDPRRDLAAGAIGKAMLAVIADDEAEDRRARADQILGWMGSSAAEVVIDAIGSDTPAPPVVRAAARVHDTRAVDPLVRLLRHADGEVRRSAAIGLEGLNDTRAVLALVSATQDPQQSVRDAASTALNSMGMAAVIVGLATILRPADAALNPAAELALSDQTSWAADVLERQLGQGEQGEPA